MYEIRVWRTDGMMVKGKMEILGEKPAPLPLSSSQIPHGLAWD
jgi:hypothetical protein